MFWEAVSITDRKTLPPAKTADPGGHSQSRVFTPPVVKPLARIVVRWRVRPMGVDVLQDLVDSGHLSSEVSKQVPTLSVVDAEFRYRPDQGVYEMVGDNRDIDCSIYQCMLNPDAPQCRSR
jgi:hypothetical protein